ncbi:MAG: alpha/beta hydrolase family protein, partial [Bdellovibrionota bacterium]|nr:alpha/beta hydrolase family protein [Bdellovibrionota bacterium]
MEDLDLNDKEGHWLDLMYLRLKSRQTLFAKGWGDEKLIKNLIRSNTINRPPRAINIHFTNQKKEKGLMIYEASFENPFMEFPKPKNSCKAFMEFIIPQGKDLFKERNDLPLVLIMPASGDDDLNYRKKKLAFPLAQKGIASVLLEIPFYG